MFALDRSKSVARLVALTAIALLVACGDSTTSLAAFQPQINNAPDNFQFQATDVTNATGTYTYTWANSGTRASADQSTTIVAGTAVLTILDANGIQVYSQSLSVGGSTQTSVGATGNWTIRLVLTNYSGTVNFRVQKA